jgi:hypothetical protein
MPLPEHTGDRYQQKAQAAVAFGQVLADPSGPRAPLL